MYVTGRNSYLKKIANKVHMTNVMGKRLTTTRASCADDLLGGEITIYIEIDSYHTKQ